jgi:hypothetical protein
MVLLACVTHTLLICGTTRCRLFQKQSKHNYLHYKNNFFKKISRDVSNNQVTIRRSSYKNIKAWTELVFLCYLKSNLIGDIPLFRYEIPLCSCNSVIPKSIQSNTSTLITRQFLFSQKFTICFDQ